MNRARREKGNHSDCKAATRATKSQSSTKAEDRGKRKRVVLLRDRGEEGTILRR